MLTAVVLLRNEPRWKPPTRRNQTRRFRWRSGEKALSIGIAAICTDGLVMCADTQITHPGGYKSHESKLSTISLAPNRGKLILAYAGLPGTMKVILEGLQGKLEYQDKGSQEIRADIQQVLDKVLRKMKDDHQMLCGFCERGTFHLLRIHNKQISPVPVWDCIGFGDSALTRYLCSIFLANPTPNLPLISRRTDLHLCGSPIKKVCRLVRRGDKSCRVNAAGWGNRTCSRNKIRRCM